MRLLRYILSKSCIYTQFQCILMKIAQSLVSVNFEKLCIHLNCSRLFILSIMIKQSWNKSIILVIYREYEDFWGGKFRASFPPLGRSVQSSELTAGQKLVFYDVDNVCEFRCLLFFWCLLFSRLRMHFNPFPNFK